jgi:hypothetical protein
MLLMMLVLKHFLFPQQSHVSAFSVVIIVSQSGVAAACFWHAFKGRNPLLGVSEAATSRTLGLFSFSFAASLTITLAAYQRNLPELFTVVAFYAAGAFFHSQAVRERRLSTGHDDTVRER